MERLGPKGVDELSALIEASVFVAIAQQQQQNRHVFPTTTKDCISPYGFNINSNTDINNINYTPPAINTQSPESLILKNEETLSNASGNYFIKNQENLTSGSLLKI